MDISVVSENDMRYYTSQSNDQVTTIAAQMMSIADSISDLQALSDERFNELQNKMKTLKISQKKCEPYAKNWASQSDILWQETVEKRKRIDAERSNIINNAK